MRAEHSPATCYTCVRAAVKVNGKWRLVDPALAAIKAGCCSSPSAPFFVPPQVRPRAADTHRWGERLCVPAD